ncbi:MAG: hypothetical protein QXT43_02465 [Candidatus Micrarchaeaceae archaeon]
MPNAEKNSRIREKGKATKAKQALPLKPEAPRLRLWHKPSPQKPGSSPNHWG